jgi:hypothetical protein
VFVEVLEVFCGEEVDEAVANVALVLDVAWQVEEIVGVVEVQINLIGQLLDGVFVGNVADHDSGAGVVVDVLREDLVEGALLIGLVRVIVVIGLRGVAAIVGEGGVRGVDVDGAGVALRKRRVEGECVPEFLTLPIKHFLAALLVLLVQLAPRASDALFLDFPHYGVE